MNNLSNTDFAYYLNMVWEFMHTSAITWTFNGTTWTMTWELLLFTTCLCYLGIWILEKILYG